MLKLKNTLKKKQLVKNCIRYFSSEDESLQYDICIVGGGIAGLSTAIKLKQLDSNINICLLEKGSEIGSHILSGNCFESESLNELFPNWQKMENPPPITQKVKKEEFHINLSQNLSIKIPNFLFPKYLHNKKNHIISLGELCSWMSSQAEELGVEIFTGFSCENLIYNKKNEIIGVETKEFGKDKNNAKTENYQEAMTINATLTILAEGARGSLSEKAIKKFSLRKNSSPQSYGIGIKELWEIPENSGIEDGLLIHSIGWPTPKNTYAGSFLYTTKKHIHLGYIIGLNYKNPFLNPYEEFQKWKTQKKVRKILEKANCFKYGARVINEGGYYSIPKLFFPGGILVGCSAGFVNVLKIKGAHNALKSGVVAAQSVFQRIKEGTFESGVCLSEYGSRMEKSEVYKELYESRNFVGAFKLKGGIFTGLLHGGLVSWLRGKLPFNFVNKKNDSEFIEKASLHEKIDYPKHDGKITFDILESVSRSDTYHEHNQQSHLIVKDNGEKWKNSLENFAGFEGFIKRKILSS